MGLTTESPATPCPSGSATRERVNYAVPSDVVSRMVYPLIVDHIVIGHGILAGNYLAKCRDFPSSQSLMCETMASHRGS